MALTRYGELRNQLMRQTFPSIFAPAVLRDADSDYVPIPISERLVQCIWYDQRIARDALRTTDGRPVRIIFPGWWNLEAGPDFRHATVQIGDEPECTGDVEVHLRADDWFHHGHHRDPLYDDVILHVVLWEAAGTTNARTHTGDTISQLVLQQQLAAPLETLHDEIDLEAYPYRVPGHGGRCSQVLNALPEHAVAGLLESAGDERFAAKTRKYARWMHRRGGEQAFYEGWMEALGYKANKVGFRTLAQRIPINEVAERGRASLPAVMFGVANFLPTGAPTARDRTAQRYVTRLWSTWWKLRPDFEGTILPGELWRLHGVRPANHPHRRLGAAVALLKKHRGSFLEKVVGAIESEGDPVKLFASVRDDYWSHHFTLGGKTQRRATELIGTSRAKEIVTNVVLPFMAALARHDGNEILHGKAKARFDGLRAGAANSIVRLASQQLFEASATARKIVKTERQQQGLMQIFQDFCLNDKSACQQCQFPELARRWTG